MEMKNNPNDVVRIRDRYELTLPKKTRDFLQVNIGDSLEFTIRKDGSAIIHKVIYSRVKNNSNRNYQPNDSKEKKKMEISESGEERNQTQGGTKHESLDKSGRSPEKTQSDIVRLSDKQDQPQPTTTKRTPDQQRETQKEGIRRIGGEGPYGRIKENW